jgi:hypothetical protein
MISSLCDDMNIPYRNINSNIGLNPLMIELANSEKIEEFNERFFRCTHMEYKRILVNLDKIKNLNEGEKFYFNGEKEIIIHSNYSIPFGGFAISAYRYAIGLGREESFKDLAYFLTKIRSFINRSNKLPIIQWKSIPVTKLRILKHKYRFINKGLTKLKKTYEDDINITNKINGFLIDIEYSNPIIRNTIDICEI